MCLELSCVTFCYPVSVTLPLSLSYRHTVTVTVPESLSERGLTSQLQLEVRPSGAGQSVANAVNGAAQN